MDTQDFDKIVFFRKEYRALKRYSKKKIIQKEYSYFDVFSKVGFLSAVGNRLDGMGGFITDGYKVNERGRRYIKYQRSRLFMTIAKSVIIPILVAVITSFVTVYILPSLGRRAEQWFQMMPRSTEQSAPEETAEDDQKQTPTDKQTVCPIYPSQRPTDSHIQDRVDPRIHVRVH